MNVNVWLPNANTRLKRVVLAVLLTLSLMVLTALPALAAAPSPTPTAVTQEDPSKAPVIFSGLSLLLYFSSSLDPVLLKDATETQQALAIMPLANIPDSLSKPTTTFAFYSVALAKSLSQLFELWDKQNELVLQSRLSEAIEMYNQLKSGLAEAAPGLTEIRLTVEQTGAFFKIESVQPESELKLVYAEVQSKLERLQNMLDLLKQPLFDNSGQSTATFLTMEITPLTAYVGDNIGFRGALTSMGEPLAGREIEILLNDTGFVTVQTNQNGRFEGELTLPYWYQPDLKIQAIYYPQKTDNGIYLGTSSPVTKLSILFYTATLNLTVEGKAYPGRTATLNGLFNYADAMAIGRSGTRISMDDDFLAGFTAFPVFNLPLDLSPTLKAGRHTITVYVPADRRYSPVSASHILEISLAPTNLDFKLPLIGLTPGSLKLTGRAYSELGPLQNAAMDARIEGNQGNWATAATGDFSARLKIAPGLNLLGTQTLTLRVQPQEPWNDSLVVTKKLFIINWISCGMLFLVLLALAVVLPRRIGIWSLKKNTSRVSPQALPTPQSTIPVYQVASLSLSQDEHGQSEKFPDAIFKWYQMTLTLMQKMTKTVLRPQQTLREYARQNTQAGSPQGHYFLEFTFLVERLLYSRYTAGPDDVAKARHLSQEIHKEEATHENL